MNVKSYLKIFLLVAIGALVALVVSGGYFMQRKLRSQQFSSLELPTQFRFEDSNDAKVCPVERNYYEDIFNRQQDSNWQGTSYSHELPEHTNFPKLCFAYVMRNSYMIRTRIGICPSDDGPIRLDKRPYKKNQPPLAGAVRQCVTERLVTITYNSFMDMAECLNLNPKHLYPKISYESGFNLNLVGEGLDAGIGQLTAAAIGDVNKNYARYLSEIEAAANDPKNPNLACQRIIGLRRWLDTPAPVESKRRCSMIATPANPIRNILYMGIFNKSAMEKFAGMSFIAGVDYFKKGDKLVPVSGDARDEFSGSSVKFQFKEKLQRLGIANPDMHFFKEMLTIAGYNMGMVTAQLVLKKYLDLRIENNLPLSLADFDFKDERLEIDVLGNQKKLPAAQIAKSNVLSSFIPPNDSPELREIKIKRRKELPTLWKQSYRKSFPEFLAYNGNNYDGVQVTPYKVYGDPGYASSVIGKNSEIRQALKKAGIDPDLCTDLDFLVLK